MLIDVTNTFNRDDAQKVMDRFGVTLGAMIEHIDSTITDESIALGARWYPEAHAFAQSLADTYGVTLEQAAGVISAVSPRMGWVRNKEIAERIIREYPKHAGIMIYRPQDVAKRIGGALTANLTIAVRILRGEHIGDVLTGIKRRSFYNNIVSAGRSFDVTVDTWMQRVVMAVGPDRGMDLDESLAFLKARNFSGYTAIAHAVRKVAERRGLLPAEVQAAYWVVASGSIHGWHWKGHGKEVNAYDEIAT